MIHSNDPVAPVGYLIFKKLSLQLKLPALDLAGRLAGLPLKDSNGYITDEGEEIFQVAEIEMGKQTFGSLGVLLHPVLQNFSLFKIKWFVMKLYGQHIQCGTFEIIVRV